MRLEVGTFEVRDVVLSDNDEALGRRPLRGPRQSGRLLLKDDHFSSVEVHLVRPGESTRLVNLLDVVVAPKV